MLLSKIAKDWQPNTFEQDQIEKITNYTVVAERCGAQLRSLNIPLHELEQLWTKVSLEFQGDPIKYPTVLPDVNDEVGKSLFQKKCMEICFASDAELCTSEDCIKISFAACAALQYLSSQDLATHRFSAEMQERARIKALKFLDPQAYDMAIELRSKSSRDKPIDYLYETIIYQDKTSGKIVEYTVVDCIRSDVSGDRYLVLENEEGQRREVMVEELNEMCID